jgi:DNA-directed RNA polymerase specialized sigma24 family protein
MDRRREYPLPTAWRGVPSPRYLRLARWLSLAEELGGLRCPAGAAGVPQTQGSQAGHMDMTLTMLSQKVAEDELRQFMATQLSRHERLVLMLFYADGLSLSDIAVVLDLPVATVGELFERTLTALQEHFG